MSGSGLGDPRIGVHPPRLVELNEFLGTPSGDLSLRDDLTLFQVHLPNSSFPSLCSDLISCGKTFLFLLLPVTVSFSPIDWSSFVLLNPSTTFPLLLITFVFAYPRFLFRVYDDDDGGE